MSKITMDVQELASLLGVSSATVYQMVREKTIPHIKIRSKIMFNKETTMEWIESLENDAMSS